MNGRKIRKILRQSKYEDGIKNILLPNYNDSFTERLEKMIQEYTKKEDDIIFGEILRQHGQSSYNELVPLNTQIDKIKFLSKLFFPEVWGLKNGEYKELNDEQCFWLILSSQNFIKWFGSKLDQGDRLQKKMLGRALGLLTEKKEWNEKLNKYDTKYEYKVADSILGEEGKNIVNEIMNDIDKYNRLDDLSDDGQEKTLSNEIKYTFKNDKIKKNVVNKDIMIAYKIETDEGIKTIEEFDKLIRTGFGDAFKSTSQSITRQKAFKITVTIDEKNFVLARFETKGAEDIKYKEIYKNTAIKVKDSMKENNKNERINSFSRMSIKIPEGISSNKYKKINGKNFLHWIRSKIGIDLSDKDIKIIENTLKENQQEGQDAKTVLNELSEEYWTIFKKAVDATLEKMLSEQALIFPALNLQINIQNNNYVKKAQTYFSNNSDAIRQESKDLGFEHFCFMFWALQSQIGTIGELVALHQFNIHNILGNIKSQGQNQQIINGKNAGLSFQDAITDKGGLNIKHYLSSELNIYNFSIGLQRTSSLLKYFPKKTVENLQLLDRYSATDGNSYLQQNKDEISIILKYYEPELLRMVSSNFDINNENTFNLFYVFSNIVIPCSYILTKLLERKTNPIYFSDFTDPNNFVKHTTRFNYSGWTFNESF